MKKQCLLLASFVLMFDAFAQTTSSGTNLFFLSAQGLVAGTPTASQGSLLFEANQNWSSTNRGTRFQIYTTQNNTTLALSRLYINHNGKIGVGTYLTTVPSHQLEILQPDTDDKGVGIFRYGGDAPSFFGMGARGSIIIPTATLDNDLLARFGGKGHDGTDYTGAKAKIEMKATENWAGSANGANMSFFTTTNGTSTPTERVTITNAGKVGIANTTPNASLSIGGDMSLSPITVGVFSFGDEDIARNGKSFIRLTTNNGSSRSIRGLTDGVDGLVVHIVTVSGNYEITNEDTFIPAQDRIITGEPFLAPNITITGEGGCTLIYDGAVNRWRLIGIQK